mmetsp:Transcript_3461/g.4356  ORF Transcript_3461/g.4356 Transcript_3461/m.4356 type:complete len:81 (+) Transcript_3461:79-321(+)
MLQNEVHISIIERSQAVDFVFTFLGPTTRVGFRMEKDQIQIQIQWNRKSAFGCRRDVMLVFITGSIVVFMQCDIASVSQR